MKAIIYWAEWFQRKSFVRFGSRFPCLLKTASFPSRVDWRGVDTTFVVITRLQGTIVRWRPDRREEHGKVTQPMKQTKHNNGEENLKIEFKDDVNNNCKKKERTRIIYTMNSGLNETPQQILLPIDKHIHRSLRGPSSHFPTFLFFIFFSH